MLNNSKKPQWALPDMAAWKHRRRLFFVVVCSTLVMSLGHAQKLPPVSRTVFKCEVAGKIIYSDSPCLGAQQIDVEPTRGMDQTSGRRKIGSDVMHEQFREAMAEGLRPLTGMDTKQLAKQGRRNQLSTDAQQECRRLDAEILTAQQDEKTATQPDLRDVQMKLFQKRKRFKELGC
ncbi:hypothetical protein [Rhodoferax antarcticus]|uniref:hypothetical protein n=1 Tax=Rhodoferax antarcticus TaxID=81479 RepID=UPI000957DEDA|nr:hypothetical protein [Rhodoferax antarcticus]APW48665.1 hypothetical protein RA876_19600 [Rhodoferax antarcticus]